MTLERAVTLAFVILITSLLIKHLTKGTNQEISENTNGEIELKVNKIFQYMGYFMGGLGLTFIIPITLFFEEEGKYIVLLLTFVFFYGPAISMMIYHKNHKLTFNDERILFQNWRKKTKEMSWAEIKKVKFDISGNMTIKGLNKKMTINQYLVGYQKFVKKLEEKTQFKAKR